MLPVLISPLGSRKAIFAFLLLSFTLYEPRASARDPALDGGKPFVSAAGSLGTWATLAVVFGPMVRTRSAQDFGAAWIWGEVTVSAGWAGSSLSCALALAATSTAFARRSAFDGAPLTASEVALKEARLDGRMANGRFGTAGTIGIRGTVGRLVALILGVISEEGVVGWVDSASEGGCDVKGVARLGPSREDSSMGAGALMTKLASLGTVSASATDPRREGSSTGTLDDCGAGVFLLLLDALEGKGPSNDCQGRGG